MACFHSLNLKRSVSKWCRYHRPWTKKLLATNLPLRCIEWCPSFFLMVFGRSCRLRQKMWRVLPKKPSTTQVRIYILLGDTRTLEDLYSTKKKQNNNNSIFYIHCGDDRLLLLLPTLSLCWPIYVRPTIMIMRQACGSNKEKLKIKFHANKESIAQVATVSS